MFVHKNTYFSLPGDRPYPTIQKHGKSQEFRGQSSLKCHVPYPCCLVEGTHRFFSAAPIFHQTTGISRAASLAAACEHASHKSGQISLSQSLGHTVHQSISPNMHIYIIIYIYTYISSMAIICFTFQDLIMLNVPPIYGQQILMFQTMGKSGVPNFETTPNSLCTCPPLSQQLPY